MNKTFSQTSLWPLQGKWTITKPNRSGRNYTQTLEINQDRLVFMITDEHEELRFLAEAKVGVERCGPFNALRIDQIRLGGSADRLNPWGEEYTSVFQVQGDRLSIAAHFDKARPALLPATESYRRSA